MQRVLYVPSATTLTSAISEEAESLGVTILHGESALSRYVEFDRDITQVIMLPTERLCLFMPQVPIRMHQNVEVTNDFIDLRDEVKFVLNGFTIVEPLILEKHYARYVIETTGYGVQVFDLFDSGMQVIEHGEYYVVNPE